MRPSAFAFGFRRRIYDLSACRTELVDFSVETRDDPLFVRDLSQTQIEHVGRAGRLFVGGAARGLHSVLRSNDRERHGRARGERKPSRCLSSFQVHHPSSQVAEGLRIQLCITLKLWPRNPEINVLGSDGHTTKAATGARKVNESDSLTSGS